MSRSPSGGTVEQHWDGPFYRVRTDTFKAWFLPNADENLDCVCDVDAEVQLPDGSRWSATIFTIAEVKRLMEKDAQTGEALGGSYFWCWDGLIVRDPGIDSMTQVLAGLVESGELVHILRRLGDE